MKDDQPSIADLDKSKMSPRRTLATKGAPAAGAKPAPSSKKT